MDYEFRRDFDGRVIAVLSMDHEVIGHWLTEEIKGDLSLLDDIVAVAKSLKGTESWQKEGHEYSLFMDKEEVMVRSNQLASEDEERDEEMESDMHYYDEESLAFCGVDDFVQLLLSYREFCLLKE